MKKTFILFVLVVTAFCYNSHASAEDKDKGRFKKYNQEVMEKIKDHRTTQSQENQEFKQSLKDMEPQARYQAFQTHRQEQFEQNMQFFNELHQQKLATLKEHLDANPNMSEAEKTQKLADAQARYDEMTASKTAKFEEVGAKIESIHQNTDMTPQEKLQAMRDYRQQLREARKEKRKTSKEQRKEHMQERKEKRQEQRQLKRQGKRAKKALETSEE